MTSDDRPSKRIRASSPTPALTIPLYVVRATLTCAHRGCVPCRYVVASLASYACVSNARPETCLRVAHQKEQTQIERALERARQKRCGLYAKTNKVLAVGDGDLTFSLALARALGGECITATTYESRASLRAIYGVVIDDTIATLETLGARVKHGVDAGNLLATLRPASDDDDDDFLHRVHDAQRTTTTIADEEKFDRIVWNFPCVARDDDGMTMEAAARGADARSASELAANRSLCERFLAQTVAFLRHDGEVHITHKIGLSHDWQIESLTSNSRIGLRCAGVVAFDRFSYPGYRPRKALVDKGFPTSDARTFVFTSNPNGVARTLMDASKMVKRVDSPS